MRFLTALAICLSSLGASKAQAADIYVDVTAEDAAGKRLVYSLREKIAESRRHNLVAAPTEAGFILSVVTLERDKQSKGSATVYSISLKMRNFGDPKFYDYVITSWVGYCGIDVTESCAGNIAAEIDGEIEPIARALAEALARNREQTPASNDKW